MVLRSELKSRSCRSALNFLKQLLFAGLDALLRIFSCNLKLARLEDVVTLQDSWHVARCLSRWQDVWNVSPHCPRMTVWLFFETGGSGDFSTARGPLYLYPYISWALTAYVNCTYSVLMLCPPLRPTQKPRGRHRHASFDTQTFVCQASSVFFLLCGSPRRDAQPSDTEAPRPTQLPPSDTATGRPTNPCVVSKFAPDCIRYVSPSPERQFAPAGGVLGAGRPSLVAGRQGTWRRPTRTPSRGRHPRRQTCPLNNGKPCQNYCR